MNRAKENRGPKTPSVTDMTQGNPLRLILLFAIPLFIGNVFQQVYNMVDTMVVGNHLGDSAIAAIGATTSLYSLIMNIANGLNTGYGIVVTQRFGAKNKNEMQQAIAGMFVLNVVVTVVLTIVSLAFLRPLMAFMNTPASIFQQAYSYIVVICGGMVVTVCYNMFAAVLRAVGNSTAPLVFLIIACLLNIVLDIAFVIGLEMGVQGAAIATVVAQAVAAILCGVYLIRNYHDLLPQKSHFRVPGALIQDLLTTGIANALMLVVVDMGTVVFQRANNSLGELYITAYTSARRIVSLSFQPVFSLSTADSTFVGQNWGAGKIRRIRESQKSVLLTGFIWSLFCILTFYTLGSALIRLTTGTSDPDILSNAVLCLRTHVTMMPVLVVVLCLRATMQAMGHKVAPVLSSAIEMVMKFGYAKWLIPALGFFGICITEPTIWVFMALCLVINYLRMRKILYADNPV